jgi:hypothetical protein
VDPFELKCLPRRDVSVAVNVGDVIEVADIAEDGIPAVSRVPRVRSVRSVRFGLAWGLAPNVPDAPNA